MVEDTDVILEEVKRMLSIEPSVTEYDIDIATHVNSAFFTLFELGIGPSTPFTLPLTQHGNHSKRLFRNKLFWIIYF